MKTKLLSAYICGSTGKVVAITEEGMYLYRYNQTEKQAKKLLGMLGVVDEIDLTHWVLEWKIEKAGS